MDIHRPHAAHSWREFAIEIGTIVLGILIALGLARTGFHPPAPAQIRVLGEEMLAAAKLAIHMMLRGDYITDYDAVVARKLANVLAGGALSSPQIVSEQYVLDLEREAVVSLCGERKTQERIAHTLVKTFVAAAFLSAVRRAGVPCAALAEGVTVRVAARRESRRR